MHLEIKQANDRTEQVSSTCIDKLYNLSKNGLLDATSDLSGSINAASAYEDAVTFLNTMWGPNLIVTASAYYIRFADPEVESVLKTILNKAEGEGITTQEAANSTFGNAFQNNTDIVEFDEYKYFTTQKNNTPNFSGCTSLESIDLTGATKIPNFSGCSNLEYFHGRSSEAGTLILENITSIGNPYLSGCSKLKKLVMSGPLNTGSNSFLNTNVLEVDVDTLEHYLQCDFAINGQPTSLPTEIYVDGVLLTNLVIPSSINTLKQYLFKYYTKLTSITLHGNLTIGTQAFTDGPNLTEIHIDSLSDWLSCTFDSQPLTIAHNLYIEGSLIQDITIPAGTNLKNKFSGSTSLKTVDINVNNTTIQSGAFSGCTALTTVNIEHCTTIESSAFKDCTNLKYFGGPNSNAGELNLSVTNISDSAFESCNGLTSVTVSNGVTSIGKRAFINCTNLASITLPNSITSLGNELFANCKSLTSFAFPQYVTSIPWHAMYACNHLTSVIIPSGVTSIGDMAFYVCTSLSSIIIEATVPPTLGSRPFYGTNNCPIYVPAGNNPVTGDSYVDIYKAASGWSEYASRIQAIPTT